MGIEKEIKELVNNKEVREKAQSALKEHGVVLSDEMLDNIASGYACGSLPETLIRSVSSKIGPKGK